MPGRRTIPALAALLAFSALLTEARPARAQAEFVEMLWKVPDGANAIALVRAEEFLNAPIALREGWPEMAESALGPPAAVSPEARLALFASRIDFVNGFDPLWQLGLVALKGPVQPQAIANADGGSVDDANDPPLIWSPRNLFYVPFKPDLVGIVGPADRQAAARWASNASKRTEPVVSEYLQAIARSMQGGEAQYKMGIDLAGLSSAKQLRPHVARAAAVDLKIDDIDAIAESLASIQGLTIEITADADIRGRMRIDFGKSTAPLKRIAKPLLLEVMENLGADVTSIRRDWSILVEDRAITYRGPLTTPGVRRIASLVELPSAGADARGPSYARDDAAPAAGAPTAGAPSPGTVNARATKSYFVALQNLLDDLTDKAVDQRRVSLWCERYADKIDRMPILGVDPELLDLGRKVSITLRNLSSIAQGAKRNVDVRQTTDAAASAGYGYVGYYGFGYGASIGGTSELAMERIVKQEGARASAAQSAIWSEMETGMADMRRTLTERYGVEF